MPLGCFEKWGQTDIQVVHFDFNLSLSLVDCEPRIKVQVANAWLAPTHIWQGRQFFGRGDNSSVAR